MTLRRSVTPMLLVASSIAMHAHAASTVDKHWPTLGPAAHLANARSAPILAAAKAGARTVAVGDHGVILLSDDGAQFRQATSVPVRSMLTTVQLLDARRGFAAGHDGVVLGTTDGGETWAQLRATPGVEQPILSLHFDNAQHGLAIGLYGWAIETNDGGRTWTERHIGSGDSDRHLYHLFVSPKDTWLIAAEAGTVFRSTDAGKSWKPLSTGDQGSLWHGAALGDGTLLVCGMRGHLYRSRDDGQTWKSVDSGTTQSLTGIAQMTDGRVVVVGLNGTVLSSTDGAATFVVTQREQAEPLTGVLSNGPIPSYMSMLGPLAERGGAP